MSNLSGNRSMLYRAFDVWKRTGSDLIRYRCFEVLPGNRFCVQSADFYSEMDQPAQNAFLDRQFKELLSEQSPDLRSGSFATIEEAIAAHDAAFGD